MSSEDLNDFENIGMIPCDICETMINFNDYNNHIIDCVRDFNLRREGFLNILNISEQIVGGNNININLTPRDAGRINEVNDNIEYNEENDINVENPGNVSSDVVNNIEVNSDVLEVVNADNSVNENNEPLVEPYEQLINNLTPLHINSRLSEFNRTPFSVVTNQNNISLSNNIGRRLISDLEINIGNLHNLTDENNNTEYDFNLFLQELMGGDVKIGVKDFNKTIIILEPNELNDNDICSICLENLKDILKNKSDERVKINLPVKTTCGHKYCRECIYKWLSKNINCPICNNKFEKNLPDDGEYVDDSDMSFGIETHIDRYDENYPLVDTDSDTDTEFPLIVEDPETINFN